MKKYKYDFTEVRKHLDALIALGSPLCNKPAIQKGIESNDHCAAIMRELINLVVGIEFYAPDANTVSPNFRLVPEKGEEAA